MSKRKAIARRPNVAMAPPPTETLLRELRQLIGDARRAAAVAVNVCLTALYWRIGKRIQAEVLGAKRAGYGEQIVATLSRQLVAEFGRGFEEKNLRRMVQFAEARPFLTRQLSPRCGDN